MREAIAASPARRALRVCETGCLDNCATGPNVLVSHERLIRTGVLPAETAALLEFLLGPAAGRFDPPPTG
ncbi:MAG TPA: (2Fe-2S) ferredoxin domain-containing protein [Planctomycetota bacterium]|nr:(2Fe-2S) ferredoxin domain-containing protein [Planctomycetota bacterium]